MAADILPLTSLPPRVLETRRLKLRAITSADVELVFNLYASDPLATRYMTFKCTGRIEDTASYVNSTARFFCGEESLYRQFVWIVELRETAQPIGSAGFGPKNKFCLSGGYIFNQNAWGKGYASEAWSCLLELAKGEPGVYRIEALHHPDNLASGRVMQKAGMTFEGVFKRYVIHPNISEEPTDSVVYAWTRR